jgi:hypothetical protein
MGVIEDLDAQIATYPETYVLLDIVEVDSPGEAINVDEEGSFRVQVTNNGPVNLTDVTVKVKGLNGVLVKTGGAPDLEYRDEFEIGIPDILGDGGSQVTEGSKLGFKAPSQPLDSQPLFKATLQLWNGNLDRILNAHTRPLDTVKATYEDEVVQS